jgi:hypothetical protein
MRWWWASSRFSIAPDHLHRDHLCPDRLRAHRRMPDTSATGCSGRNLGFRGVETGTDR